jgi:hypothetical protein
VLSLSWRRKKRLRRMRQRKRDPREARFDYTIRDLGAARNRVELLTHDLCDVEGREILEDIVADLKDIIDDIRDVRRKLRSH